MIKKITNFIIPITFITLWSSGYLFANAGLKYCSPLLLLTLRLLIASIFIGIFLLINKISIKISTKEFIQILVTGFFLQTMYLGFIFLSFGEKTSPGFLAIILGMQPLLTLFFSAEKTNLPQKIGIFLATFGLISSVASNLAIGSTNFLGIFYALLSLLGITIGSFFQKIYCSNISAYVKLFIHYLASFIIISILTLFIEPIYFEFNSILLISILWTSLVVSVFAVILYYSLLNSGKLVNTASLLFCVPVLTSIFDYIIFNSKFSITSILGIFLIIFGLILITKKYSSSKNIELRKIA
ncbi:DMT family transporter [Pigmentibacter sp. JX0631]|uniref:DMT family transporter n=1 Tax=Pigmentibacter sp. JX0631 TaxID=2976982 RepID=UPI002469060B|nr:DMT family transporter [Pigmentibacter sp. JX0631]WGL60477.1 DMT family transporter [Pigmentibacter sp. JX0631]